MSTVVFFAASPATAGHIVQIGRAVVERNGRFFVYAARCDRSEGREVVTEGRAITRRARIESAIQAASY